MRRLVLVYFAFALCFMGIDATAADQYGEWVLEQPRPMVFTLSFKQSLPQGGRVFTSELGFVCNGGAILIPFEGKFQNSQAIIPLVIIPLIFCNIGKTQATISLCSRKTRWMNLLRT
jgi:hypothetical protein